MATGRVRRPTRSEEAKILHIGHSPSELFREEQLAGLIATARERLIAAIDHARVPNPRWKPGNNKKFIGTDNFIIGVAGKPSELARYVLKSSKSRFIELDELPNSIAELTPFFSEMVRVQAQFDVMRQAIVMMTTCGELRYDEGAGIWEVLQSCIDEQRLIRRSARTALKWDDRSYHGRPRRDRGAVPDGVSVSFA